MSGSLNYGYHVASASHFVPQRNILMQLWLTQNGALVNKLSETSINYFTNLPGGGLSMPFTSRSRLPLGDFGLFTVVDPTQEHVELSESNNASQVLYTGFFLEKIPGIMNNLGNGWDLPAKFLNEWFNIAPMQIKSDASGNGLDWTLPRRNPVSTDWLIDPQNAVNSRIIDKYNQLIDPTYFNNQAARQVLKAKLIKKYNAHPNATSWNLSTPWATGQDYQVYHEQQTQKIEAQVGGIEAFNPLDAVTGAFGGFWFYLVPIGTAKILDQYNFKVVITALEIHVVDSFDFNGYQPLGYWAEPNYVSMNPFSNGMYVQNYSFRMYRWYKARGGDYVVFTTPKVVPIHFETHIQRT